jgi:hypothetical protein
MEALLPHSEKRGSRLCPAVSLGRRNGALVIVRIERYANPSADYHLENAQLVGVDVVGGANFEEAMTKWRQPKFMVGPSSGYRIDESYMGMTKPKNGE